MAVNVKILGSGKQTLVLAHGYGGSQAIWDNMVPDLAKNHRVLVFDWSFSGAVEGSAAAAAAFDAAKYSSYHGFAGDLVALLDGMELKDVVYVGHSMSGMIGCIAAVQRPDLFAQLVLVAASPRYINTDDYEGGFELATINDMFSNIQSNFHPWAEAFVPVVVGADDPASVAKFAADFTRMNPDNALAVAKTIFLGDYRHVLQHVEVPCTLVHGTNDVAVPLSVGRYMKSNIRGGATLEVIEMDGHCPQLTVPEKLAEVLHRALK